MENYQIIATTDSLLLPSCNEEVSAYEAELLKLPQVEVPVMHTIHGGIYTRTILIKAGTVLTGALISCDSTCHVYGDITVTTDDGIERLTGFHIVPATAGRKRAGKAHADTIWSMSIATDLIDLAEIENYMTAEAERLASRRMQS